MNPTALFWIAWCIGLLCWLAVLPRLSGLTLLGAAGWAGAAWAALAVCQAVIQANVNEWGEPTWGAALRFAAAAGAFAPVMSVLGAKRPQHTMWHFIVLSLWGVLALPSLELLVLQPGQQLEVHDARAWFLVVLIFVAGTHLLATRFWLSGLLLGAGLTLLFAPHLPMAPAAARSEGWAPWLFAGATATLAAAMLTAWLTRSSRRATAWDQLWSDFRDAYGALWALRVAQRINDAASTSGWPVQLQWHGFLDDDHQPLETVDPQWRQGFEHCLRGLLRRFVSPEWIDKRLARLESDQREERE